MDYGGFGGGFGGGGFGDYGGGFGGAPLATSGYTSGGYTSAAGLGMNGFGGADMFGAGGFTGYGGDVGAVTPSVGLGGVGVQDLSPVYAGWDATPAYVEPAVSYVEPYVEPIAYVEPPPVTPVVPVQYVEPPRPVIVEPQPVYVAPPPPPPPPQPSPPPPPPRRRRRQKYELVAHSKDPRAERRANEMLRGLRGSDPSSLLHQGRDALHGNMRNPVYS